MTTDWSQIQSYLDELVEKSALNLGPVHTKQKEISSAIAELKGIMEGPDDVLNKLASEIDHLAQAYAEKMLIQLDSAEGMLGTLAQTKATIEKDLSLKKTLELEIVQLSSQKRLLEQDIKNQSNKRDVELHRKTQLEQELALEVGNIERYRQAQEEMHEKLGLLEEESKELRTENAKLQTKLKHLEENIEGMKLLKEEHMLSIMQNTEVLSKISSGTE